VFKVNHKVYGECCLKIGDGKNFSIEEWNCAYNLQDNTTYIVKHHKCGEVTMKNQKKFFVILMEFANGGVCVFCFNHFYLCRI
jgi:hypothetical protein